MVMFLYMKLDLKQLHFSSLNLASQCRESQEGILAASALPQSASLACEVSVGKKAIGKSIAYSGNVRAI